MDTYIRRLIQVTLSDGNANYQNEVEKLYNLPRYLVVFSVVLMIFIGMFTRVLSNTLVEPMVKLAGLSREIEKNHFDMPDLVVENRDEMGELVTAFNRMKHSMGDYISTLKRNHEMTELLHKEELERVEMEKQLEAARLEFLKSQINPHFLYNTLDAIGWMCEEERSKEAVERVNALARLCLISISRGHELIPNEKEVEHARSYLKIQKFRYKDQFEYEFQVDESCLGYYCNKITLQPIIENAIYQGIDRIGDQGFITFRSITDGDDIGFQVEPPGLAKTEAK